MPYHKPQATLRPCHTATTAKTAAKPLDTTRQTQTTLECRPSTRPSTNGPGRLAHSYGLEGLLVLPRRFRSSVAAAPCGPGRLATGSFVMLAVLRRSNATYGEPAESTPPAYAVPAACP